MSCRLRLAIVHSTRCDKVSWCSCVSFSLGNKHGGQEKGIRSRKQDLGQEEQGSETSEQSDEQDDSFLDAFSPESMGLLPTYNTQKEVSCHTEAEEAERARREATVTVAANPSTLLLAPRNVIYDLRRATEAHGHMAKSALPQIDDSHGPLVLMERNLEVG